jgi:Na+/melibiose symporter-like transporter
MKAPAESPDSESAQLPRITKAFYALGDHTINVSLSSLSFFYAFFLVEIAGIRPALAGLIPLIGRVVDAVSDPAMGRISDRTSWRWGRRRPYFLIGAAWWVGAQVFLMSATPAGAPGVFVLLAAWVTLRYPLGRARHAEILEALRVRRRQGAP